MINRTGANRGETTRSASAGGISRGEFRAAAGTADPSRVPKDTRMLRLRLKRVANLVQVSERREHVVRLPRSRLLATSFLVPRDRTRRQKSAREEAVSVTFGAGQPWTAKTHDRLTTTREKKHRHARNYRSAPRELSFVRTV